MVLYSVTNHLCLCLCASFNLYFVLFYVRSACCCTSAWEEILRRVTAGGPTPSGRERVEREAAVAMATLPCGSDLDSAMAQPAEKVKAERMTER